MVVVVFGPSLTKDLQLRTPNVSASDFAFGCSVLPSGRGHCTPELAALAITTNPEGIDNKAAILTSSLCVGC